MFPAMEPQRTLDGKVSEAGGTWMGKVAAGWGILGVAALLVEAELRLVPKAADVFTGNLSPLQWVMVIVWVAFMGYAEGWHGFHRRFSPRVVARAATLIDHPTAARALLAPLFCMSLFHASRRGLVVAWGVWIGVVAVIGAVSTMAPPWRGIIDAGVVVGLGIGTLSLGWHAARALAGRPPPISPDLDRSP
jgi:hypothetical protein